jgi:hypothetical protein
MNPDRTRSAMAPVTPSAAEAGLQAEGVGSTLVAYYGHKPPQLQAFIGDVQGQLARHLGDLALLRPIPEVHATVLGLVDPDRPAERASQQDETGYLAHVVRRLSHTPVVIRWGGYDSSTPYPFRSRGRGLWERSFVLTKRQAVVIGWPWVAGAVSSMLDQLRREGRPFGLQHKYHQTGSDFDPDAYMVVADLAAAAEGRVARETEDQMRRWLLSRGTTVPLTADDLRVVTYTDNHLPQASSDDRRLTT